MSAARKQAADTGEPTYVEKVAERIIEQLQQGTAPWQRPWKPGELQRPYNPTTGKPYRGGNVLWLMVQGHGDPRWMTYKQAVAADAQVRKGEKGTVIQYVKSSEDVAVKDANGKPVRNEDGTPKLQRVEYERPRVFSAVVFNASQIDGLPALAPVLTSTEWERHQQCDDILQASGVPVKHMRGNRAFYSPAQDAITLPERDQFPTADRYYATALHELGHATGHPTRLNRDLSHPFGSEGYAREELRAEIASLLLGERFEIGHDPEQHMAYVGSWIKALQSDPREIFRAAADAEKIVDYVQALAIVAEQTQEQNQVQRADLQLDSDPARQIAPSALATALKAVDADAESLSASQEDAVRSVAEQLVSTEAIVLAALADDRLDEALDTMTAEELNGVRAVLVATYPVGPENPFWERHSMPAATASFEAAADAAIVELDRRLETLEPMGVSAVPRVGDFVSFFPAAEHIHKYGVGNGAPMVGLAVDVAATQGGNWRVRLQTSRDAAQGGGKVEHLVYSHEGRMDVCERLKRNPKFGMPINEAELGYDRVCLLELCEAPDSATLPAPTEAWSGTVVASSWVHVAVERDSGEIRAVMTARFPEVPHDGQKIVVTPATSGRPEQIEPQQRWAARNGFGPSITPEKVRSFESIPRDLTQMAPGLGEALREHSPPIHLVTNTTYTVGAGSDVRDFSTGFEAGIAFAKTPAASRPAVTVRDDDGLRLVATTLERGPRDNPKQEKVLYADPRDAEFVSGYESARVLERTAATPKHANRADALLASITDAEQALLVATGDPQSASAPALVEARVCIVMRNFHQAAEKLQAMADATEANGHPQIGAAFAGVAGRAAALGDEYQSRAPVSSETSPMAIDNRTHERRYLAVPYAEKDRAKAAGAMWDKGAKSWFAPPGADLNKLAAWLPENRQSESVTRDTPEVEFGKALAERGLLLDGDPIMDGERHRVPVEGDKKGAKSGMYIGFLDGHPAGHIQNHLTGTKENWKSQAPADSLTDADRKRLIEEAKAKLAARDAARAAAHDTTRERLAAELADPTHFVPANPDHAYLKKKGLAGDAGGLMQDARGNLVIPAHDAAGTVWTLQRIGSNGFKSFEDDGKLEGHYHLMPGSGETDALIVTEGWSTGETIRRATGADLVVAFNAGNLPAVAEALRAQFPDRPIVIAGDNDHRKPLELDKRTGRPKENVGAVKAKQAAERVNGAVALPAFPASSKGSDWNDYGRAHGLDAVREAMAEAIVLADRRRLGAAEATGHDAEQVNASLQVNQARVAELTKGMSAATANTRFAVLRQRGAIERDRQDTGDELPPPKPEQSPRKAEQGEALQKPSRARSITRSR